MGNINTVGPNEALVVSGKIFCHAHIFFLRKLTEPYPVLTLNIAILIFMQNTTRWHLTIVIGSVGLCHRSRRCRL